jgi:glycerol-3-phosphate dehydrogenase
VRRRADALAAIVSDRFDVLVVGGGITGAGVALDASSRGYSVALVERADYASGTSSRSSKLIHGGLRYLQSFDLGLVREALLERRLLARLAPHLVRPLPMIVAAFEGAHPDRLVGIGLNMYDVMSVPLRGRRRGRDAQTDQSEAVWSPDRHRIISGDEVSVLLPALAGREPTGGYLFYDCQTDDVRLVLTVLGEAERFGAVCANRAAVTGLRRGPDDVTVVSLRDGVSGEQLEVRAELRSEAELPQIVPSRGTHVLVPEQLLPLRAGAIVPVSDGRSIFALPWLGRSLVGTTDEIHPGEIEHVRPSAGDIVYLLDAINGFFGCALTADDLAGAYAGVRPLISSGDSRRSVDISRREELFETSSGMITITGGKLTTWRRMAKLAVDRLVARDGRQAPCRTHEIPLGAPVDPEHLPRVAGVAEDAYAALAARYGHAAREVLELTAADPKLAAAIVDGQPDLLAEARYAAAAEQAGSVGDVLLRRTRLGLVAAHACAGDGGEVARIVAQTIAPELGWNEAAIAPAVAGFADEAAAEGIIVPS